MPHDATSAPRTPSAPISLTRRLAAALISGFGTAAITYVATILVFFAASGSTSDNLLPISNFFLPAALVLFLLMAVATALGANRFWFITAGIGIVAGIIAALAGTALGVATSGSAWTPEVIDVLVGSILGTNLVFIVATAIVAATAGRSLWSWALRTTSPSRGGARNIVLVRPPSSHLQDGELTHLERTTVDADLADEQWEAYVAALEENGFTAIEVSAADELADSVFIEDTIVMFGRVAVVTSPGAESRRPETEAVRVAASELDLDVRQIDLPGTLDGGDVLKVGTTVYVGRGGRTNAEGIRQLRAIVSPLGYTVIAVPVTKVLHLKSAVTALPDGTVIGYLPLVEQPELFGRFLAVPEETGSAVVVLAPDAVLMASSAPKTAELIADLGYRVVTVDVSEFEKLEGCVTCLSVRVR
jgi:dimethylargininase